MIIMEMALGENWSDEYYCFPFSTSKIDAIDKQTANRLSRMLSRYVT